MKTQSKMAQMRYGNCGARGREFAHTCEITEECSKMAYKRMIGGGGAPSRFVIPELEDQHLTQIATSDKYQFIVLASCVPLRAAQSTTVHNKITALRIKATEYANRYECTLVHVAPRQTSVVRFCCCGDEVSCEEGD